MTNRWAEEKETKRWGDEEDEEQEDEQLDREEKTFSTQPDENGIKIVTTFRTNDQGQKVKITQKLKVTKKIVKINNNVAKRRKWAKFGKCENVPPGPEPNVTYVSPDTIPLNLKPRKREEEPVDLTKSFDKLTSVVICRLCNATDHYSIKCPKRKEIEVDGVTSGGGRGGRGGVVGASAPGGKYVPVHLRDGGRGRGGGRGGGIQMGRDDSATIRVTNISEDTTEDDLRDLFRPYGHTTRIYLAKDKFTHKSRGFAFISYTTRNEAQRAITALNDKGYDNLILHVEFAQPREREETPSSQEPAPQRDRGGRFAGGQLAYEQVDNAVEQQFDSYDGRAF